MAIRLIGLCIFLSKCLIVKTDFVPVHPRSISFSSLFPQVAERDLSHNPNWEYLPEECGTSYPSDRIIGGLDASLGEYPWLVQLGGMSRMGSRKFVCGSSLITNWYAITAGHCVKACHSVGSPVARLGENYVDDYEDCEGGVCAPQPIDVNIEYFLQVNRIEVQSFHNDIALVKFDTRITFNDFIKPICLPTMNMLKHPSRTLKMGDMVEVAGWGLTNVKLLSKPNKLQHVSLPVVSMDSCKATYKGLMLDNSQLCVGEGDMRDSCLGDSGGPLMKIVDSDYGPPKYYLVGVVSFGLLQCGTSGAIYVNIMHYMNWILDNLDPSHTTGVHM